MGGSKILNQHKRSHLSCEVTLTYAHLKWFIICRIKTVNDFDNGICKSELLTLAFTIETSILEILTPK